MNNISDIKHAFYINLASRPDRKQHVEEQLKIMGIPAQRFNAIKLAYIYSNHSYTFIQTSQ